MSFNCLICMDNFDHVKHLSAINCGHVFHEDCLKTWISTAKTCPQCRKTCTARNMTKLFLTPSDDTVIKDEMAIKLKQTTEELKVRERELIVSNDKNRRLLEQKQNDEKSIKNLNRKVEKLERYQSQVADRLTFLKTESYKATMYERENSDLKVTLDQYKLKVDVISSRNRKLIEKAETCHQIVFKLENKNKGILNQLKIKSDQVIKYQQEVDELKSKLENYEFIQKLMACDEETVEKLLTFTLNNDDTTNWKQALKTLMTYVDDLKQQMDIGKNQNCSNCQILKNKYETMHQNYLKCKEEISVLKKPEFANNLSSMENNIQLGTQENTSSLSNTSGLFSVDFFTSCKKISTKILDNQPSCSKSRPFKIDAAPLSIKKTIHDSESVTRSGYNGLGGHETVVIRTNPKTIHQIKGRKLKPISLPRKIH